MSGTMPLRVGVVLLLVWVFALPEEAAGRPFWRRRARTTTSYSSRATSSGPVRVAPKADSDSSDYRPLKVYYCYDRAAEEEVAYSDRIRVFLRLRDAEVLEAIDPLVAEVKYTDLTDQEQTGVVYVPVSLITDPETDEKVGVFDVVSPKSAPVTIRPMHVYRLFVNLHRRAETFGKHSVLGRVPTPYYVATSGPSRLDRARRHIVMRAFKEFYYTEKGWPSDEQRPLDCHAYYCWATASCTVGAQRGRANLVRLWGALVGSHRGGHIPQLAGEAPVAADYVRIPGHTFMLLAYDSKRNQVWTMESNFNRTIEVAIRPVGSGWTVGHLQEEHIRPELFVTDESLPVPSTNIRLEDMPAEPAEGEEAT